jgi:1,6-anhydro-N-acetylmuramate kinase
MSLPRAGLSSPQYIGSCLGLGSSGYKTLLVTIRKTKRPSIRTRAASDMRGGFRQTVKAKLSEQQPIGQGTVRQRITHLDGLLRQHRKDPRSKRMLRVDQIQVVVIARSTPERAWTYI